MLAHESQYSRDPSAARPVCLRACELNDTLKEKGAADADGHVAWVGKVKSKR